MPADSGRGLFVRAGVVTLVVLAVWRFTAIATGMPPLSPLGPQPVYASVDSPVLVSIEPVLHAPWLGDSSSPMVWAGAFFVLLGAAGVAVFAGATTAAALCVLAALVLDASFSAALAHSAGLAVSVGLIWLAAGAAFDDRPRLFSRPLTLNALAALALWALAVWWDWIAVVAWPIVWAAFRRAPERRDRGLLTAASIVLGVGAFVAHFAWMASMANTVTPGLSPPVGWRDALSVAFNGRPRMALGSFAAPELTTRLGYQLMLLAAAGLVFGTLARWWRRTALLSAAFAVVVALAWPAWQAEVLRFSAWVLAPLSAVGLTWVGAQGRRPLVITCALGAVALMETIVSGSRPADGLDARGFRDALADDLSRRAAVAPLLVVAEDTRVDSALVSWMATRAPQVQRAVQDGAAVARARAEGRTVIAGPVARRHLELGGVSFAEEYTVHPQMPFQLAEADGTLRCASVRTDRWSQLPGLEYTGRLGIELPGRLGGELQIVVGDALALPLRASLPEGRPVPLRMEPLMSGPGAAAPPADYWIDGSVPEDAAAWMRRVHVAADPLRASMMSLELGRRAPRVIARLSGYEDEARGRICAAPLGAVRLQQPGATPLPLDDESLFGTGWYGREGRGPDAFRWADADAVVLVRSAVRANVEIRLQAAPAAANGTDAVTVSLRVNGIDVGTRAMERGRADHTWQVPAGVWLAGTNELWWQTSRAVRPADTGGLDTRSLALHVTGITLTR
jgi:hypothetical protein